MRWGAQAARVVGDAVSAMSRLGQLRALLSDQVDTRSRFNARGDLLLTLQIPPEVLLTALQWTEDDPDGIAKVGSILGGLLAEEFVGIVEEAEEDAAARG